MDLSLLPLVFSLILTVASRLLHAYHTDDKTSRLMEKRFSTVRNTQRGLQSYMEERRWRKETEVTRRRRVGIKRGENYVVGAYCRILICCTCHFQSGSLFVYFGFLGLQVSSVSNFCPDTKVVTYLGSLVQLCCGEEGTLQTDVTGMCGECSQ